MNWDSEYEDIKMTYAPLLANKSLSYDDRIKMFHIKTALGGWFEWRIVTYNQNRLIIGGHIMPNNIPNNQKGINQEIIDSQTEDIRSEIRKASRIVEDQNREILERIIKLKPIEQDSPNKEQAIRNLEKSLRNTIEDVEYKISQLERLQRDTLEALHNINGNNENTKILNEINSKLNHVKIPEDLARKSDIPKDYARKEDIKECPEIPKDLATKEDIKNIKIPEYKLLRI
jgi:hypothetical protein